MSDYNSVIFGFYLLFTTYEHDGRAELSLQPFMVIK